MCAKINTVRLPAFFNSEKATTTQLPMIKTNYNISIKNIFYLSMFKYIQIIDFFLSKNGKL